jgi:lipoate-protein ligase A
MEKHSNQEHSMVQVVATTEQAKLLAESRETVEIVDASGKRLGTVVRPPSEEDIRIAKERIAGAGNRYTTDEVISHLQSLEPS